MPQHLDPDLQKYIADQRRQQFWSMLSQMGQGLMAANRRGQSPIQGLSAGLSAGLAQGRSGGGLIPTLRAQDYLTKTRQEQQQKAQYGKMLHTAFGGGVDPSTGIDWNTARIGPGQPTPGLLGVAKQRGMSPALLQGMLAGLGPAAGPKAMLDMTGPSKAPTIREFKEGGKVITRRWDPNARQWVDMTTAPRFKPGEAGGPTDAQVASNREIDQARVLLQELERDTPSGVSLSEELQRRMSARDPATGRLAPDYKSYWGRIGWLAMQNKVGVNDPDQARWSRLLVMPPQFSEPAGAKPLPPGVSAEQPGLLQRGYNALFGDGGASQPSPPGVGTATPRAPGPRGPRGRGPARRTGGAKQIEAMTADEITALVYGGRELSQGEKNRIDARLKALGL